MFLTAFLVSCSSDSNSPAGSPGTATSTSATAAGSTSTTIVRTPRSLESGSTVTFPAADPSAVQVFAGLADVLPMSDEERSCAATRLAGDAALFGRVKSGAAANTPDFNSLAGIMTRCRQAVTFAKAFVSNLSAQFPNLTDTQRKCLSDGYGALSAGDLDLMMGAGLNPKGSDAPKGGKVLTDLLSRCAVGP